MRIKDDKDFYIAEILCSSMYTSIVIRKIYQGKRNLTTNLMSGLFHESYRLRHMGQWRGVKRWNLSWNKWGCVWLRRITLEHRSSVRRSVQSFLRTIKNRFVMHLLFHWALNTVWQSSFKNWIAENISGVCVDCVVINNMSNSETAWLHLSHNGFGWCLL